MSGSILFLLGAGASHGAGINGIGAMTEKFIENIGYLLQEYYEGGKWTSALLNPHEGEDAIVLLKKTIERDLSRFDIELLLEALFHLEKQDHILFSILNFPDTMKKYLDIYPHLKNVLIRFIRKECEDISTVNYLYPLSAFNEDAPLDIFTLNYDGTIEAMCKIHNISFTDGFKEEWNNKYFEDESVKIKLYKLHGSLYWFRTKTGKYVKLPIKNIDVENLIYFMDEEISETVIWPMLTKDVSTGPFPWLMEEFRQKLGKYDLCITLGYSFRDQNIKDIVLDQMKNNSRLWLFVLDHHSEEIKRNLCYEEENLKYRIVTKTMDIEDSLLNRILIDIIRKLSSARRAEEDILKSLLLSQTLDTQNWSSVFRLYRNISHYDRIKYLVKYILENYEGEKIEIPSLQWIVFDLALQFGIEHYLEPNYEESLYWLKIFKECSYVFDWILGRGVSPEHQIISPKQLPDWVKDKNPDDYASYSADYTNLINSIENCIKLTDQEKKIQLILTNFIKAIHEYDKIHAVIETRQERIETLRKNGLAWSLLSRQLINLVDEKDKGV